MGSPGHLVVRCVLCCGQTRPTESPRGEAPVATVGVASVRGEIRLSRSKHSSKYDHNSLAVENPTHTHAVSLHKATRSMTGTV